MQRATALQAIADRHERNRISLDRPGTAAARQ
jgi:hypothetical protein